MIYWDLSGLTIFSWMQSRCMRVVFWWNHYFSQSSPDFILMFLFLRNISLNQIHKKLVKVRKTFRLNTDWINIVLKFGLWLIATILWAVHIYLFICLLWQQLQWYIAHCHSQGGLYNGQDYPSLKTMKSHYLECRFLAVILQGWSLAEVLRLSH